MISVYVGRRIKKLAAEFAAAQSNADYQNDQGHIGSTIAAANEQLRLAREAFFAAVDKVTTQ